MFRVLWLGIFWASFCVAFPSLEVSPNLPASADEALLKIAYKVECKKTKDDFPGITGSLKLGSRTLRFELFSELSETSVLLSDAESLPKTVTLEFDDAPTCEVITASAEIAELPKPKDTIEELVWKHTPYIAIRDDQYGKPIDDIPLILAYSIHQRASSFSIKYTLFMTDENSLWHVGHLDASMARYARRTDIEWTYEIEFETKSLAVVGESYHSSWAGKLGHAAYAFDGKYLPKTRHPILYDFTSNNVFNSKPTAKQAAEPVGHHLIPSVEIPEPRAREIVMMERPWMFRVADREQSREKKLSQPFSDYLYVRTRGKLIAGTFVLKLTFDSGVSVLSGGGKGNIDRLGEDVWKAESYSAIPLDAARLARIGKDFHGKLVFLPNTPEQGTELQLKEVGFSRVAEDGMKFEDISDLFDCGATLSDLSTECRF
jgi:hypothetical protein